MCDWHAPINQALTILNGVAVWSKSIRTVTIGSTNTGTCSSSGDITVTEAQQGRPIVVTQAGGIENDGIFFLGITPSGGIVHVITCNFSGSTYNPGLLSMYIDVITR